MNRDKSDFAKGSIPGHIIYLSIPMIISQLVQMLYSIVDRIYIGHISGESGLALTGLGLTFPIVTIISVFTNLYAIGGSPLFAIARGAQDEKRAQNLVNTTFSLLLITSLLLISFFYLFLKPILFLLGASETSYPFARDYLIIYLIGTSFLMISSGMTGFIISLVFSLWPSNFVDKQILLDLDVLKKLFSFHYFEK